jgi:hypothetical protein
MVMVTITIDGLTMRQKVLADIIWKFETRTQINSFIRSLPTVQLQNEASSIVDLMVMATVEQAYAGLGDMEAANQLIKKVAK